MSEICWRIKIIRKGKLFKNVLSRLSMCSSRVLAKLKNWAREEENVTLIRKKQTYISKAVKCTVNRRCTKCWDGEAASLGAGKGSHPSFVDLAQHVGEPLLTQVQQHHQVKATGDELILRLQHTAKLRFLLRCQCIQMWWQSSETVLLLPAHETCRVH